MLGHVEDPASDDVCGEQVGCELYPLEIKIGRVCESFDSCCLGKSRNTFQKYVTFAYDAHDEGFDHLFLTDYDL